MTMTAKHFQEPLLQVLGDLTGFKAGVVVRGEDTYQPVMTLMSIPDIDHLGTEAGSGQPLVQRNIQWACKNLRKTGQVDLQGRGQWVLTDKGVSEAKNLAPAPAPVAAPVAALVAAPARAAILSRGPLDDPYILNLILEQTSCLGHFTPHQRAECVSCAVAPECRNKLYARYSQAAAKLATVDRLATGLQQAAPAAASTAAAPAAPAGPKPILDLSSAQKIKAFEEAICSECGQPIPKNSECFWIEDIATDQSFMVHLDCPETTDDPA